MQWEAAQYDPLIAEQLRLSLSVSRPLAQLLAGRGFSDPDEVRTFINPLLSSMSDPYSFPGVEKAADRIWKAISAEEKITVFGDYDADGVTSTALMASVLTRLGGKVSCFIPDRIEEGYGLGVDALSRCLADNTPSLIVTVDCGSSSHEAVKTASEAGVDVIVTDHHEISDRPVDSYAVCSTKLSDVPGTESLAGVGVAFKLCHSLVKMGMDRNMPSVHGLDLRDYLDVVAIGTVADMVPLEGENRILVRHGLVTINRMKHEGLRILCRTAKITSEIDAHHIGFQIAPRINAAGRMGDPRIALDLLLERDNPTKAGSFADRLERANVNRRTQEASIRKDAEQQVSQWFDPSAHFAVVAADEGWSVGTIGIVASRLANQYQRPAIVISFNKDGEGRGSCRSVEGVDLTEVLEECSSFLLTHGGHKMAAGLNLKRDQLEGFKEAFNSACRERCSGSTFEKVIKVDAWIDLADVDIDLVREMQCLQPTGMGNPSPVWGIRDLSVSGKPSVVGGTHLKMRLVSGASEIDSIAFGMGQRAVPEGAIDVLAEIKPDSFRGGDNVQLHLKDFRKSNPLSSAV